MPTYRVEIKNQLKGVFMGNFSKLEILEKLNRAVARSSVQKVDDEWMVCGRFCRVSNAGSLLAYRERMAA